MTWHVSADLIGRYADGAVSDAEAWSVETHLAACGSCRCGLEEAPSIIGDVGGVDDARLARIWGEVNAGVRATQRPLAERVLVRLGVADHTARLVAATPSLTASWLTGVMLVLAAGVAAAWLTRPDGITPSDGRTVFVFLLLAPLLPVVGVAVAFGPRVDPTYDLAMVAPLRSWRLLMVRSMAVIASSLLLASIGALTLPQLGWVAAGWLLPSLALSTSVLAMSARWSPMTAATAVGAAWLVVVLLLEVRVAGALVAFGAAGQTVTALLFVVALSMVLAEREHVDPAAQV